MMKKPFSLLMAVLMVLPLKTNCIKAENDSEIHAESWKELCSVSGGTVILDQDLIADSTVEINGNLVVDLNGHTITQKDGSVFVVADNGNLTLKDSEAQSETITDEGITAETQASVTDFALTYYVTTSEVTDAADGLTSEYTQKHSVILKGRIQAVTDHPLIQVNGGTFNLESGTLLGKSDESETRGIQASGGTINLSGGYIAGFCQNDTAFVALPELISDKSGAGVNIVDTAVNATGTVLTGNRIRVGSASYGGDYGAAMATNGNSSLMINGSVFSGNRIDTDEESSGHQQFGNYGGFWEGTRVGGAALAVLGKSTATIESGYLTENRFSSRNGGRAYYFDGGGAMILGDDATVTINSGYITGNVSTTGGGAIKTLRRDSYFDEKGIVHESVLNINGGFISGNSADCEGGGIAVDKMGSAVIRGGYITNNSMNSNQHWGGGGIFCSDGTEAKVTVFNALITQNTAGGFGGGVAGCSTGRIMISAENGGAVFANKAYNPSSQSQGPHLSGRDSTKRDDVNYASRQAVFMENGFQDYFCALSSSISDTMLGGGSARWKGSADGNAIETKTGETAEADYIMGLTSESSEADRNTARKNAKVYITGNESYTHGGGIMINGYLYIGSEQNTTLVSRIFVTGKKVLKDDRGNAVSDEKIRAILEADPDAFMFSIRNSENQKVTQGRVIPVSDDYGNTLYELLFDNKLVFDHEGKFTYTISEDTSNIPGIETDPTVYALHVSVGMDVEQKKTADGGLVTQTEYFITKADLCQGDTVLQSLTPSKADSISHTIELDADNITFTNTIHEKTDITVSKKWNKKEEVIPESLIVTLKNNLNESDTKSMTLNKENHWTAEFKDLPVYGSNGNLYIYKVEEQQTSGYLQTDKTVVTGQDGNTTVSFINTPITGVTGQKIWEDDSDAWKRRPETITVNLYANGKKAATEKVSANDSWHYSFTELPKYSNDGEKILYTVDEERIPGYSTSINGNTITNTYLSRDISVKKVWDDDGNCDGTRPDSVQVILLANGNAYGDPVTLSEENKWSTKWENLSQEDEKGNAINWTVAEINIPEGYATVVTGNMDTGYIITNRHESALISVPVSKTWKDGNDADHLRPSEITIHLYADGTDTGKVLTLNEENDWKGSFEDLPFCENGTAISYTVVEDVPDGYTAEVSGNAEAGYAVTNTHDVKVPETSGSANQNHAKPENDRNRTSTPDTDDKNRKTPDTGDHQNVALYGGMTLTALLMAGIVFVFRKRRS